MRKGVDVHILTPWGGSDNMFYFTSSRKKEKKEELYVLALASLYVPVPSFQSVRHPHDGQRT